MRKYIICNTCGENLGEERPNWKIKIMADINTKLYTFIRLIFTPKLLTKDFKLFELLTIIF